MTPTLLILSSAALHATWNALVKGGQDSRVRVLAVLFIAALVSPLGLLFFSENSLGSLASAPWVILSGLCEAGYLISLGLALQSGTLGASYTIMRGGAMILIWIISVPFLSEEFNAFTLAGILFIFIGIRLTQHQNKEMQSKGVSWALLAALFICGYHLSYGQALKQGITSVVLFSISLWIAVPLLALAYGRVVRKNSFVEIKKHPIKMILGGIICSASFIIFLTGLRDAGAGHAIMLRNTSVIFAQIFATVIGEKVRPQQIAGSILVGLGATLPSL